MDNLAEEKRWYTDAVRSDLILNRGMMAEEADSAIEKYQLKKRLDLYPDIQLHYGIKATTKEMEKEGCF